MTQHTRGTVAVTKHIPANGYSLSYVMGLTDEQIAKQLAFCARLEAACIGHGRPFDNPCLLLQREQLRAEKMRREGHAP